MDQPVITNKSERQLKKNLRLERHPGSGQPIIPLPKKHGYKGNSFSLISIISNIYLMVKGWGKDLEVNGVAALDPRDPNWVDEDEENEEGAIESQQQSSQQSGSTGEQ